MEFNIPICVLNVLLVVFSGFIAFHEGTFRSEKVAIGFVNHGGMWGDLFLFSIINGFVAPHIKMVLLAPTFVAAFIVTLLMHKSWAYWMRRDGITGHMFPTHQTGAWSKDMSVSGWLHVIYMTFQFAFLLTYALSPMPANVVWLVSVLLTVHIIVGVIQPDWYVRRRLIAENVRVVVTTWMAIWGVGIVKMIMQ